jgi:hypothetical protein
MMVAPACSPLVWRLMAWAACSSTRVRGGPVGQVRRSKMPTRTSARAGGAARRCPPAHARGGRGEGVETRRAGSGPQLGQPPVLGRKSCPHWLMQWASVDGEGADVQPERRSSMEGMRAARGPDTGAAARRTQGPIDRRDSAESVALLRAPAGYPRAAGHRPGPSSARSGARRRCRGGREQRRKLEAQGLAPAGGQHDQRVATLERGADGLLLDRAQCIEPPEAVEGLEDWRRDGATAA